MNIEYQKPVVKGQFFDRKEILTELKKPKNFALIGKRKSGKTSILWEYRLMKSKNELVPYIYLPFSITPHEFSVRFLNNVIGEYLSYRGVKIDFSDDSREDAMRQIDELMKIEPALVNILLKIRDGLNRPFDFSLLSLCFELPERMIQKQAVHLKIMLDEFQVSRGMPKVIDILREKIVKQKKTFYVVSGSLIGMMKDLFEDIESPLFGHFEVVYTGRFEYKEAKNFVLKQASGRVKLSETSVNLLLYLCDNHPYYLAIFIGRVLESGTKQITKDVILQVLREELFNPQGNLNRYFYRNIDLSFEKRNLGRYFSILKAIANNKESGTEISEFTGIRNSALPKYLNTLIKFEFVRKIGSRYAIEDKFMKLYLRGAIKSDEEFKDVNIAWMFFKDAFEEILGNLKSELGVARESQIREIFARKGYEVSSGYFGKDEFDVIVRGQLVGEIKTKNVGVRDVRNFLEKIRGKKEKAILFVLFGIDKRAGELCRREGIEVWDLERINKERKKLDLPSLNV